MKALFSYPYSEQTTSSNLTWAASFLVVLPHFSRQLPGLAMIASFQILTCEVILVSVSVLFHVNQKLC
jgi:hypothetical protein